MNRHWVPLKAVATLSEDVLPESTSPNFEFEYVDIGNVTSTGGIAGTERLKFGDAPSRARKRVQSGDVIVSTVRTYLKAITSIDDSKEDLVVSTGFAVLRPQTIDPNYLAYALRSEPVVESIVANSQGVSYPAIAPSRLMRLPLPVPSRQAQGAIVRFLDDQAAKIDSLSVHALQLAELLKAQFLSEWCAEFEEPTRSSPADLKPLKYVAAITTGITPPSGEEHYYMGGEIPWFGPSQCATDFEVWPAEKFVTKRAILEGKARLIPPNSTFVVIIGASVASVAFCRDASTTNQQIAAVAFAQDVIDPRFGAYQLKLRQDDLLSIVDKTTLPILDIDALKRLNVWVPSRNDQERILEEMDEQRVVLKKQLRSIRQLVSRLEEYRASLVTAAVTGQIDVGSAA